MTKACAISTAVTCLNDAHDAVVWGDSLNPVQLACVTQLILTLTGTYGPEYFTDDEIDLINEMHDHCIELLQGDDEDDYAH